MSTAGKQPGIDDGREEYRALEEKYKELLIECIEASCQPWTSTAKPLNSFCNSTYADWLRSAANLGIVRILRDDGHRGVTAEWVTKETT